MRDCWVFRSMNCMVISDYGLEAMGAMGDGRWAMGDGLGAVVMAVGFLGHSRETGCPKCFSQKANKKTKRVVDSGEQLVNLFIGKLSQDTLTVNRVEGFLSHLYRGRKPFVFESSRVYCMIRFSLSYKRRPSLFKQLHEFFARH